MSGISSRREMLARTRALEKKMAEKNVGRGFWKSTWNRADSNHLTDKLEKDGKVYPPIHALMKRKQTHIRRSKRSWPVN